MVDLSIVNYVSLPEGKALSYTADTVRKESPVKDAIIVLPDLSESKVMKKSVFLLPGLFLVGALEHFFPYIGNNHPKWRAYFSEGLKPPTRFHLRYLILWTIWDNRGWFPWIIWIISTAAQGLGIQVALEWACCRQSAVTRHPLHVCQGKSLRVWLGWSSFFHSPNSELADFCPFQFTRYSFDQVWLIPNANPCGWRHLQLQAEGTPVNCLPYHNVVMKGSNSHAIRFPFGVDR